MSAGDREAEAFRLQIKVAPRASRNAIVGWQGDVLKLSVTAAADRGAANAAVIALLAGAMRVAKSRIEIRRGAARREKLLLIRAPLAVLARLPSAGTAGHAADAVTGIQAQGEPDAGEANQ